MDLSGNSSELIIDRYESNNIAYLSEICRENVKSLN